MYVLDPSTAFATLVDTVRNQEQMFGPVVIVGVGYASEAEGENRSYDLTPPTDPKDLPAGPPAGWGATGGNDAFPRSGGARNQSFAKLRPSKRHKRRRACRNGF
jgi:predicted alpha/beta superfamily hydrolase